MSQRSTVLAVLVLLFTLPTLAIIKSNIYEFGSSLNFETCSQQIEDLKICTENTKITVNSGEPVVIKVFWINSSDTDRYIGTRISGYSVVINNERGEKLVPTFLQRQMEREKRLAADPTATLTEEDRKEFRRWMRGGSDRGIYIEANQKEADTIKLTEINYDYDLTKKGKYQVTISKTIASLEQGKTIEFVLDNIELEIK